jgi:hypothetical protein
MMLVPIDTSKLAKRLQAAGMPRTLAEELALALAEELSEGLAKDIARLRAEIAELRILLTKR